MADVRTRVRPAGSGRETPTGRPGDRRVSGPRWGLTVSLWFTLSASLGSLHPIFQGAGWWFAASSVSALVFAVMALARRFGWPGPVVSVVGLVVAAAACTFTVSGGTAVLGVVPTSDTVERVRLLAQQAMETIVADQAPVVVSTAILAVVVTCVAAATLLIDVVARTGRMPGLTGIVFVVVLVVPSLVPDVSPSWPWVVLTVVGFASILLVSTGRRPSRSTVITGVAALAAAGVVTSLVPVSLNSALQSVGTGTGISTGVNPAINLGNDLRRGTSVDVLSYTTTSSDGEYLKLVDLVDFTGRQWSPASVRLNDSDSVSKLPAAPGISSSTRRSTETTRVSVSLLRSPYLPIPVPATAITGVDGRWKYVDASGVTVRSASEGSQGLDYTVTSKPVNPTRAQIVRSLGQTPADLNAYTSVAGVPGSISTLAKRVTAGAANPFDAAVDLQDYFRDGEFSYSESTPVSGGYDGTGLDAIEVFLQRKSGYCVHFASAMAVMARTLGIPSRIAVGFLPGTQNASSGRWTVTSNDLHTWPELYFQGLGWVRFEPTVGQGTTSAYLQQTGTEATPSDSATASPTNSATAAPTTSAGPTSASTPASATESTSASTTASGASISTAPLVAVGVLVLILLALAPWWLRSSRRRRRLGVGPPDSALNAWREVVDTSRDLGMAVDGAATPQATAGLLSRALDGDHAGEEALQMLLGALEAERFGDAPASSAVHESARSTIAALRHRSSVVARARALLAPRSLFSEARPQTAQ